MTGVLMALYMERRASWSLSPRLLVSSDGMCPVIQCVVH